VVAKSCTTLDGRKPEKKWGKSLVNWCRISSIIEVILSHDKPSSAGRLDKKK